MALTLIITNAGRAALVDQSTGGTRAVRIAAVGVSATAFAASPTTVALPDEVRRIVTIAGEASAADVLHLTVQDETDAVYTVRSFALYLDDGTLFAAFSQSGAIVQKAAQSVLLLAIDVKLVGVPAGAITFGSTAFIDPPATTDRRGVVELATLAEARAGEDAQRAVTPAAARASVRDWLGYTPANRAGDSFGGPVAISHPGLAAGLRVARAATGYGFLQLGESADATVNWHFGSPGDGTFAVYQGNWGTGVARLRVTATAIAFNDAPMWTAANDGAGSGLDADLLDGQQGGWYADVAARLGYTPANRAGDGFAGPVAINHPGLAAGLRVARATTGYGFLQLGEGADATVNWHLGSGGDGTFAVYQGNWGTGVARLKLTATAITYNDASMWTAANDGAGSGLDADLLDGLQASAFVRADASTTTAPDVAIDLPNSGYGIALRLGGNGYTAGGLRASVVSTDGTLHLDAAGVKPIYLAWFAGAGVVFGNGAGAAVATVSKAGVVTAAGVTAAAMARSGFALWGPDNDGAGSGLDADLLDGQQGGWYADIVARLGYTPASRAGDTFSGDVALATTVALRSAPFPNSFLQLNDGTQGARLSTDGGFLMRAGANVMTVPAIGTVTFNGSTMWTAANDGAGSGLDADLLDGQQGGWYADVPARLGYAPLPAASYTAGDVLAKAVTVDGAGSGLDADLLDGYHASDFVRTSASSFTSPGYRQHSDGFIEQWGEIAGPITTRGNRAVAFPIAFPNVCLGIEAIAINPNATTSGGTTTIQRVALSPSGATLRAQNEDNAISDCAGGISWRAWGH